MDLGRRTSSGRAGIRGANAVGRSLDLTWWISVASVVLLQLGMLSTWLPAVVPAADGQGWRPWVFLAAGVLWVGLSARLLAGYRAATSPLDVDGSTWTRPVWLAFVGGAVVAAAGLTTSSDGLVLGCSAAAQLGCLGRWPPPSRRRVTVLLTVVLVLMALVDASRDVVELADGGSVQIAIGYAVLLPAVTSFTLWWWDLVEELDRARLTEGRLAAAQERLSLASDVHDLQGHHLQVIALQLELAERLLDADPAAAAEQVRAARASVDEAREGTRGLAMRFRGVPLPVELENAADLMRAADLRVDVEIAADASEAPSAVLGPVVRESTTNVLRHGTGDWAELSLGRDGPAWVYRISNGRRDDGDAGAAGRGGQGVAGIVERVRAVGGDARVERTDDVYALVVTVPDAPREAP